MNKFRLTIKVLVIATFVFAFASAAQAQATRTWVSGVGDDLNPCSRTAPCKTFAGAISKTAAGGEIDALDPGGFGAVTITKSITIDGTHGAGFGSILASGVNGVNVNDSASGAPNTIVVTLRKLSINGAGTTLGLNGVNFTSGKSVNIENCEIFNFSNAGINLNKTTGAIVAELYVSNTSLFNVTRGIRLSSTFAGSTAVAYVSNVEFKKNSVSGIEIASNSIAEVRDSSIEFSPTGVNMTGPSGQFYLMNTLIAHSTTAGITATNGTGRIQGSHILANAIGVNIGGGGVVRTFGDNKFDGNPTPIVGALTAIVPANQ